VTGFDITQLQHTQNQTYDFTRNGLLVQYTFTVFPGRMAGLLFLQLFPDPVKARSGRLAPFRGHGFVEIVYNKLGLHRQLASSVITQ